MNEEATCPICGYAVEDRYVARDYPFSDVGVEELNEYDDAFPPCPKCGERWWMPVSGLDRAARWAFVIQELPSAVSVVVEGDA